MTCVVQSVTEYLNVLFITQINIIPFKVEGAFIMGLGYWTSEQIILKSDTGEVLTDRSWNYYVPQARDIPQDFRVYFRKKSYGNAAILGSKGMLQNGRVIL